MYDDYDYPEPSLLLPLLIALAVHLLAVVGLAFGYKEKPTPKVVVLQASVIDAKALKHAQSSSGGQAKKLPQTTTQASEPAQKSPNTPTNNASTPSPSEHISQYNEQMAERERAYQEQMANYANSLDRQIAHNIEQSKQAQREADEARQREVDALRSNARSSEEIARENLKSMNEAKEHLKSQAQAQNAQSDSQSTKSTELDNSPAPSIPNVGQGGQVGSKPATASKSQAQANIAGRVQAIWEQYKNPKNRHLTATIVIDENGNLLSVSFGAGDRDLQPSLEESIRKAAPFPEMKGISTSFSIRFYTD